MTNPTKPDEFEERLSELKHDDDCMWCKNLRVAHQRSIDTLEKALILHHKDWLQTDLKMCPLCNVEMGRRDGL